MVDFLFNFIQIERLQILHSKDFIHRDIKPENFCFGLEKNKNTLFLIDFGLARRFRDSKSK